MEEVAFITLRMRITHTANVILLPYLSSPFSNGGGGGGGSRHMHYLVNAPGHEHFLAKDSQPLGMNTFWLKNARYAIDIRIAFLLKLRKGTQLQVWNR